MTPLRRGSGRAYAEVIGDPIGQSKSPAIHTFWLSKLGIEAEYRATQVTREDLAAFLAERSEDLSWRGCNLTMPLKVAAFDFIDDRSQSATAVGAANCIFPARNGLVAENTDVAGILAALPEELLNGGCEVCIIGSGGAARAALAACRERNVGIVLLSARNQSLGWRLIEEFRFGGTVRAIEDAHNILTADVVINATPLGMQGNHPMPAAVLDHLRDAHPWQAAFDMVYHPIQTPFLVAAAAGGMRTIDGLAMLIGQAANAFEIFFGQPAPREHDAELRELLTR